MKKSISFILVMLMVLCMVPGVAMAEEYVAMIGTQGYPSIKAAVDAAANGDTVVVTQNHTINDYNNLVEVQTDTVESLINVKDKTITIDLNGKTVIAEEPKATVPYFILITSTGNSHLTLKDSVGGGAVKCKNKGTSTIYCLMSAFDSQSSLTVESGHYELDYASASLIYADGNETVTINGGTFRLGNVGTGSNGSPWIFNVRGGNDGHITVNNGTFNDDIANQHWKFEVYIEPGKVLVKNGDMWTLEESAAYVTEDLHYVPCCSQYTVGYQTLKEAIEAAKKNNNKDGNNDFISLTLNKDCLVSETIVIDFELIDDKDPVDQNKKGMVMNGKTIIWEGNDSDPIFTVKEGGLLTVNGAFTPQKANHIFQGWYTDKDYKTPYDSFGVGAESTIDNTNGSEDISLYAKWIIDESNPPASPEITPAPISSGYSGPGLWYIGGNTFGVTTNQVPTSVEIDNVPVSFTMNGNQITVDCIQPGSDWVTVRWGSVSNQRSFTPDANAYCTQPVIPKTGDVSLWAAIAEFFGF